MVQQLCFRQEPSLTIKQDPKPFACGGEEKIPAPKQKTKLLTDPVLTDLMVACYQMQLLVLQNRYLSSLMDITGSLDLTLSFHYNSVSS
jgi:hypothetical protein